MGGEISRPAKPVVDLTRFMGRWYVIASRPTAFEKGAHEAIEEYTWNSKAERIDVRFSYKEGSFDGPEKVIRQKGWVVDHENNSYWKVQPLWPLKLDYLILDVDPDYQWTSVGVPDQSYLWIMARTQSLPDDVYQSIVDRLQAMSYDTSKLAKVPQIR